MSASHKQIEKQVLSSSAINLGLLAQPDLELLKTRAVTSMNFFSEGSGDAYSYNEITRRVSNNGKTILLLKNNQSTVYKRKRSGLTKIKSEPSLRRTSERSNTQTSESRISSRLQNFQPYQQTPNMGALAVGTAAVVGSSITVGSSKFEPYKIIKC